MAKIQTEKLISDIHKLRGSDNQLESIDRSAVLMKYGMKNHNFDQCYRLKDIKENVQKLMKDYESSFWRFHPQRNEMIKDYRDYLHNVNKISEYLGCDKD